MADSNTNNAASGWQVTATTIFCDHVNEFITIMVNKDWSCKCTWAAKYKHMAKLSSQLKGKADKCTGAECKNITDYRDKLKKEEAAV